jgi:hypothetical protein
MLDTRYEQLIERLHIHLLDFRVSGQHGRVYGVLEMLGASLHNVVELIALRDEQDLESATLQQQELATAFVQLDHLILIGELEELLHVQRRDRLVRRVDDLQQLVNVIEAFIFKFIIDLMF